MDIDSIYRLYFRDVFLFLQGLTHNEALAEELTQETFFKALDGLKDYDDRQDVRAWLFTVARNAYYSHCRRTKHTAPLEDAETAPADTPDIAQLLVDQDAAFTVHQCLHTLDEPYKEVFCSPALAGLFLFVTLLRTKRTPPRLWAGGVLL